jgi:site-specific DNA recombinase
MATCIVGGLKHRGVPMAQSRKEGGFTKPTVVLYARVSSKEQEREGFSVSAQLHLLRNYASSNNLTVSREFIDVETAKQTGRSGFNEMVQILKKAPARRILLVEKTDRLYRNIKDWVTLDDMQPEIHFVKENVVLSAGSRSSENLSTV